MLDDSSHHVCRRHGTFPRIECSKDYKKINNRITHLKKVDEAQND
jgi:hypothetical protein